MRNAHLEREPAQFLATKTAALMMLYYNYIILYMNPHLERVQQSHGDLLVANPNAFINLPLTCNAVDHHPLKLEGKNIACLTFMGTSQQTE